MATALGIAWPRALLVAALTIVTGLGDNAVAQTSAASDSVVRHSRVSVQVPVQPYFPYTAYLRPADARVVVHLQPRLRDAEELLLDAHTGLPWSGTFAELQTDFTPLPAESSRTLQIGRAWDQRMAQLLGCAPPWSACSSPADADVLLFSAAQPTIGRLELEVVDMRDLFARVEGWLSGEGRPDSHQISALDWTLIDLAMQQRARRERWLDLVRATETSPTRWNAAREAFGSGPRLGERPVFQAQPRVGRAAVEQAHLDLNSELQEAGLRMSVRALYRAWERDRSTASLLALAQLLQQVGQAAEPGRLNLRVGATMRVIEVFFESSDEQRLQMAQALGGLAVARRSENLWCAARWVAGNDCSGAPAWGQPAPPARPAPAVPGTVTARPGGPETVQQRAARSGDALAVLGVQGISAFMPGEGPQVAGDATQELDFIQRQKNHMVLATFDERSGKLGTAPGAAQGFVFVARALGALRDGRFEVQMAPATKAPVTLRHGRYRVKVVMTLDKTTEEQCNAGFLCKFKEPVSYARPYRKTVFFQVQASEFTDKQVCDFGPLLPTVADGGERYAARLKDLRLAIESVRFELP